MSDGHSAIEPPEIGPALSRADAVVDVRSPAEFAKGAIAGAVNIPLFSNGERAEIGTLYKLLGKNEAIHKGLDLFGSHLSDFIRAFEPFKADRVLIYCARGGMRSTAVVGLLSAFGYQVEQLPGGYKAFRNHVLSRFEVGLPPRLIVIHGQTGVGKTVLLNRLDNALDLEDCAQHRSSVFGAINLKPRTQQQFDAHLLAALEVLDPARPVWVEGESRRIGEVTMPDALRRAMQTATCVLVTGSLPVRVGRIVAEYGREDEATHQQWETALRSLVPALGHRQVETMIGNVRNNDYAPVVEILLLDYYDTRYRHAMRNYRYALTVSSDDLEEAAASLAGFAARAPHPSLESSTPGSQAGEWTR